MESSNIANSRSMLYRRYRDTRKSHELREIDMHSSLCSDKCGNFELRKRTLNDMLFRRKSISMKV